MAINYDRIKNAVEQLGEQTDNREFLRLFLDAYDFPKSTFARITWPSSNTQKGVYVQNKIYFVDTVSPSLYIDFDIYKKNGLDKIHADFLIIVNQRDILSCDLHTLDVINGRKSELSKNIEFFYPLLGIPATSTSPVNQSVDIKVAEKFAHLYNEMHISNQGSEQMIAQFMCRMLFCCFMDSSTSFVDGGLYSFLTTYTEADGSDCCAFFNNLFGAIRTPDRNDLPGFFEKVHHLDARLFPEDLPPCLITRDARNTILELIQLDWNDVTPEILGALIQSIAIPSATSICGNYTSTANIQKIIGPLYMNGLYSEYSHAKSSSELLAIHKRIKNITILDPSCGTGNFLLVAYKELQKLEELILTKMEKIGVNTAALGRITVSNFFGIEERHFSCEIARLGFLFSTFQRTSSIEDAIEAYFSVNIICNDPLRTDWNAICGGGSETYIIGNPNYCGANRQTPEQKNNILQVFSEYSKCSNLDYAACWFLLAAKFLRGGSGGFAFVTTNSLTQGNQVQLLWPKLYNLGFYIQFAHTSFKWKNDARNRSAVTVVIIGMINATYRREKCELYLPYTTKEVQAISPYLVPGNAIIGDKSSPLANLPTMVKGNMPYDNGLLLLSSEEERAFVSEYPEAQKYLRHVVGSDEFINGKERWCLWIHDDEAEAAMAIPGIRERVEKLQALRMSNKDKNVQKIANRAYQFRDTKETHTLSLVIPAVYSENYLYTPIGFIFKDTIVTNLASVIYDCEPWIFGIIASEMHNIWIRTVCGKLEQRIRYSLKLGYNTFPIPNLNDEQKRLINKCVMNIVAVREAHAGDTLATLYHKDKMPNDLRLAHKMLDEVIDKCYRDEPFLSNEDRLTTLFSLYEAMEV